MFRISSTKEFSERLVLSLVEGFFAKPIPRVAEQSLS
jgi:hypothetical protein